MKYGISIALVLATLSACARIDPAPVASWTAPPSIASANGVTTLRIERGDTLLRIAHRYHRPVRLIIEANHMVPPYRLAAGAILILPGPEAPMVAAAPPRPRYTAAASDTPPPTPRTVEAPPRLPPSAVTAPRIASPEVPPASRPPLRAEPGYARSGPPPAFRQATATLMPPPMPEPPSEVGGRGFIWPVRGRVVEGYGIAANGTHNDGINIAARAGSAVRAAKSGEVVYVGNELRGYGNLVLIKHPGGYLTAYAHNSVLLVRKGEHVARGQIIARVGATGEVREPQLHFEIRAGRSPVNPTEFLPPVQQASAE
ncbi:MAG TPA: M23 family metallopeptidase [Stellaceae bacterium]|jgi:murein DD-endopeptidase MepM/ murein hydrolase activator NlpD|nr:M23 family metallopeptidase [Stellaceae bacterium]